MQKTYRKNGIPDLRRRTHYWDEIDLKYLAMRYFIPVLLMIGVMMVAATPNSNFPATI